MDVLTGAKLITTLILSGKRERKKKENRENEKNEEREKMRERKKNEGEIKK